MTEQMASVEVEKLVKRFGNFTAVDQVSFQVFPGEIFGFLGSNGAGKSTTIRMLCGLLLPSQGAATVAGYDVYTQAEQIKQGWSDVRGADLGRDARAGTESVAGYGEQERHPHGGVV